MNAWAAAEVVATPIAPAPARSTLRERHNRLASDLHELAHRLNVIAVPLRPDAYMSHASVAECLADDVKYLRKIIEAIAPVFERCADDAADYANARVESFDIVRGGLEDFLSPISAAAEELSEG